jgi:hypothetical protein
VTTWCNLHPELKNDASPALMIIKLIDDPGLGTLAHGTLDLITFPCPCSVRTLLTFGPQILQTVYLRFWPAPAFSLPPRHNVSGHKLARRRVIDSFSTDSARQPQPFQQGTITPIQRGR